MQSGAFFLGQFRSRSDALFRPASAAASRRSSAFAGRDHARSLLAGSEQPRFLAGQRGCADANLLFLCVSGTAWIRTSENSAGRGFLRGASCGNSSCLTTRCARLKSRMKSFSILRKAPTTLPRSWGSGTVMHWRRRNQSCIRLRNIRN